MVKADSPINQFTTSQHPGSFYFTFWFFPPAFSPKIIISDCVSAFLRTIARDTHAHGGRVRIEAGWVVLQERDGANGEEHQPSKNNSNQFFLSAEREISHCRQHNGVKSTNFTMSPCKFAYSLWEGPPTQFSLLSNRTKARGRNHLKKLTNTNG